MRYFKFKRQHLLLKNSFRKYLKYAIGEIILVVLGILIALQINNWNTNRINENQKNQIYLQLKDKIGDDKIELVKTKNLNAYFTSQFAKASQIISSQNRTKIDTLAVLAMQLSQYSDFQGNGNIYENLVNSGDIKLLKNSKINIKLQNLEMTYNYINKLEDIHWELIINELSPELKGVINYSNLHIQKPEKLFSVEMQNIFIESIFLTKGKDSIYSRALEEINSISNLINLEIELNK